MLNFNNVYKKYDNGTEALKNVNLQIDSGEFVFLIGASGSGKSTLLKLILMEEISTSGEIYFKNVQLEKLHRKNISKLRRQMGVVFQDFRLLPNKTAYENVAYAMEVVEASEKKIKRDVPKALELVGLEDKANSYPDELSGGEQQRIAIARAIVNKPDLIIADEPTGNLDPENSKDIIRLFSEINKNGTTVLIATHEKNIVNAMGKRVVEIDNGVIVRDEEKGYYDNEN